MDKEFIKSAQNVLNALNELQEKFPNASFKIATSDDFIDVLNSYVSMSNFRENIDEDYTDFIENLDESDKIDLQYDEDENFFICPHCEEPICGEDYSYICDKRCPICEEELI